jgi:hypothetical protein
MESMSQTQRVRLDDSELIELAREAVRAYFPEHVIATSTIEIRHSY